MFPHASSVLRKGIEPAPTTRDRPFHLQKPEYADRSIDAALSVGKVTAEDTQLIRTFIAELQATQGIGIGRSNKIIFTLLSWRKFIGAFRANTITDLYQGINALKNVRIRGKPYKQNTQRDFLNFIKRFYKWLIERGYSSIPAAEIQKIKVPRTDTMTKTAEQMLTEEEVRAMIDACMNSRDRALIATLYEGGFRIEEIGELAWGQLKFDEYGTIINTNKKTEKPRYIRLVAATSYLAKWKNDYAYAISPEGLVFPSFKHLPLRYEGIALQLKKIAIRAGIQKNVTPHLFRHSRITHLLQKGYSETIIKKMMWGNIQSTMFATYVHLTDGDIDEEVLRKQGIHTQPKENTRAMEPRQCIRCATINAPTDRFCSICGLPLTKEEERSMEQIQREIEQTPEFRRVLELVRQNLTVTG